MLKLEEFDEGTAPKELQELVDAFSKVSHGKSNELVVSAALTMIANVIDSEVYNYKLSILKGITSFIITMSVRVGIKNMPTVDCDAKTHKVDGEKVTDTFQDEAEDIETKVASVEDDIADSKCEGCESCEDKACIDKGK